MKNSPPTARIRVRVPAGRVTIRMQTRRVNVPRSSPRPVERTALQRRGRKP
jgi:hypothetical protein